MHGSHPTEFSPREGHTARRWFIAAGAAAIVVVLGGLAFRAWLTAAPERVTVGQAVDRYRSTASSTQAPASAGVPQAGVYVYATDGRESVDALGGDAHVYPSTTTLTVTVTDCGFRMFWAPVTGRSDTTDVCRTADGIVSNRTVNAHEFFRMSQTETFTCASGSWWLPPTGTTDWTATCESDGGRTTARIGHVLGTDQVVVDGEALTATHVRFDDTISGTSSGVSTTDLWLDPATGLPLREVSSASTGNDTPIGRVTFTERIDLTLQSRTPTR